MPGNAAAGNAAAATMHICELAQPAAMEQEMTDVRCRHQHRLVQGEKEVKQEYGQPFAFGATVVVGGGE